MLLYCNGKKDFCHKEVCDKTCEYYDGTGSKYVKKQSLADKIRSMNDEELAAFLYPITCGIDPANFYCKNKKECEELMDADKEIPDEWCRECLAERLQQPAEAGKLPYLNRTITGLGIDSKQDSGLVEED